MELAGRSEWENEMMVSGVSGGWVGVENIFHN